MNDESTINGDGKTARHVISAGGHLLSLIDWDPHANFQCRLCHRVFERILDATEDPCDVVVWS